MDANRSSNRVGNKLGTEPRYCTEHHADDYCFVASDLAKGIFAPDVTLDKALKSLHEFFNANYIDEPKARGRWHAIALQGNWDHLYQHVMAIDDHGLRYNSVLKSNLVNLAARALCMLQLFEESEEKKK